MNKKKITVIFALSCFYSVILTNCIGILTNIELSQKIFIFLCLEIILFIIVHYYFKHMHCTDKKYFIYSFLLCILFTLANLSGYKNFFNETYITIAPKTFQGENTNQRGAWISNIYVDDKEILLSDFELPKGWYYQNEWDDIIAENNTIPEPLTLNFMRAESIKIRFAYYNSFAENTTFYDGDKEIKDILLIPDEDGYIYNVTSNQIVVNKYIYVLVSCLTNFLFVYFIICAIRKKNKLKILLPFITLCILINTRLLDISASVKIFMCFITLFCGLCIQFIGVQTKMIKYLSQKGFFCVSLISLYASFTGFGHSLFLKGDLVQITIEKLALFIIGAMWFHFVILMILFILESIKSKMEVDSNINKVPSNVRYTKLVCVLIFYSIWQLILVAYWPGNLSSDSVDQWMQAIGQWPVNTAHPAVHTLIIKLLANLIPSPFFVLTIQILLVAIVMGYILSQLNNCLKKNWIIYALCVILALHPGNFMLVTTLWKDIPFTLCLVVLTILLYHASVSPLFFWTKGSNIVIMILALIGVKEFRHNGLLVFGFTMLLLIIWAIKYKQIFWHITSVFITTIGMIAFIQGPIYQYFNVNTVATAKPYITMFTALGSVLNKGYSFSDDTNRILNKIMTQEDWVKWYSPFNIDSYRHNSKIIGGMDINQVTSNEAFQSYFEGLIKYPDIIIKDRLDGANIIWDIAQPQESFNYRYSDGIWFPSGVDSKLFNVEFTNKEANGYQSDNLMVNILRKISSLASSIQLLDIFIFRGGIYLLLYFILLLFNCLNKKKWFIVSSIPVLGNTLALMLLLAHQSYRYVWYIMLCTITLLILTILDFKRKEMPESI